MGKRLESWQAPEGPHVSEKIREYPNKSTDDVHEMVRCEQTTYENPNSEEAHSNEEAVAAFRATLWGQSVSLLNDVIKHP